jgi:hypothetical protein
MSRDLSELAGMAVLPDDEEATPTTKAVLCSLCAHANHKTHRTIVGVPLQAREAKCSTNSVRKAHRLLKKWGAARFETRSGDSHDCWINAAWLRAHVPEPEKPRTPSTNERGAPSTAEGVTPSNRMSHPFKARDQPLQPLKPNHLDQKSDLSEGADADAPIGSGGGGRDDTGDRGTTSTDAPRERSRSRELALPRPPTPDVEAEGHEHEHDAERSIRIAARRMPGTDEPDVDHATAIARAVAGLDVNETDWWRAVLHAWRRTGKWDTAKLGPAPGTPGCRVPAELLPKSFTAIARKGHPASLPPPLTVGDLMMGLVQAYEAARAA